MQPPCRFGLLHHPKIPQSQELAREVAAFLAERGCRTWIGSSWDQDAVKDRLSEQDILVTLGGDGTILRAARIAAPGRKPIIGINLGRVGFLAELSPDEWQEGLAKLLVGDYWLERRMMLRSEHWQGNRLQSTNLALNEVVVARGRLARVVRIGAHADGAELSEYLADGLIAATPTGSTAYAFAAGGPIMPPTLRNILLVPIAPMSGLARPVVLSEGAEVWLTVDTDHEAILSVDGQWEESLASGDRVCVQTSHHAALFARVRPQAYFYESLSQRLRCR